MRFRHLIMTISAMLITTLTAGGSALANPASLSSQNAAKLAAKASKKAAATPEQEQINACERLGELACSTVQKLQSFVGAAVQSFKDGKLSREELRPVIEFTEKWMNSLSEALMDLKARALQSQKKFTPEDIEKELNRYGEQVREVIETQVQPLLEQARRCYDDTKKGAVAPPRAVDL